MYANGVFEGSGVKGIGIVGGICYFEEQGYKWINVAGTSSGSLIAALLVAGYSGLELKQILFNLDYKMFMDKTKLQSIPILGKSLGMVFQKGIYSGDQIEKYVKSLLEAKSISKFKDISINGKSRLKLIAADITSRDIVILPDDLIKYGIDPMEFPISAAVRMSCSIPLYFRPYKLNNLSTINYIVDGGILSNFPIWIFDTGGIPSIPTLGFKINEPPSHTSLGNLGTIPYIIDIIETVINEDESRIIKDNDLIRTTTIPSSGIKSTNFNITMEQRVMLFDVGYSSAREFYKTWSFSKYIATVF
jgi:NTE family protein